MVARDVRKNHNIFVDGRGYAGQSDEFNAPELTQVTEQFRGGGMVAPVALTMGLEELKSSFSLIAYDKDVLALFGVVEGKNANFIVRELLESFNGTKTGIAHTMRGKIVSLKPGTSKAGTVQPLQVELSLVYYKLEHGGTVVHEIDVENMVYVVNGVDLLAQDRALLGI